MTLSFSRDDIRSGMLKTKAEPPVSDEEMQQAVRTLLRGLGEDPDREGLVDTPKRVVKALKFLTSGYHQSLDELLNGAVFHENANEMVLVRDIDLFSSCEHHILPILGRAHVAYIPNGKVIGLSKIARICEMYARRLQVQERLTAQIADALEGLLKPQGVAVVVEATHMCRSEEHTSELQSRPHISYAVFCLKKKKRNKNKGAANKSNRSSEVQNTGTPIQPDKLERRITA